MGVVFSVIAKELKKSLSNAGIKTISCRQTGAGVSIVISPIDANNLVYYLNEFGFCTSWGSKFNKHSFNGGINGKYAEICNVMLSKNNG